MIPSDRLALQKELVNTQEQLRLVQKERDLVKDLAAASQREITSMRKQLSLVPKGRDAANDLAKELESMQEQLYSVQKVPRLYLYYLSPTLLSLFIH
jgi:hypothetical protein